MNSNQQSAHKDSWQPSPSDNLVVCTYVRAPLDWFGCNNTQCNTKHIAYWYNLSTFYLNRRSQKWDRSINVWWPNTICTPFWNLEGHGPSAPPLPVPTLMFTILVCVWSSFKLLSVMLLPANKSECFSTSWRVNWTERGKERESKRMNRDLESERVMSYLVHST